MSVGFDFRVDVRPYSGYSDPSLPIAAWIAQAGAVGNASGGVISLDFLFQLDGQPLISELFNLEQLSVDTISAVSREVLLSTLSMDQLAPNRPGSTQFWRTRTIATTVGSAIDMLSLQFPIWLGSPNRDEGDSGLRIEMVNVDLLLYAATLQGYMWGPRSVLAQGGPQRPVGGGLFGA